MQESRKVQKKMKKSVDLSICVVQWRQMKKGDTGSMIQAANFLQMACSCGSSHKRGAV